jgi:Tfp pilus assembly protein PilF
MGHDPQLRDIESPRLDSWKEIASFLHRDARTVRRWERERRLPVHRVPGGERSGVFAYVAELESWLHDSTPASGSSTGSGASEKAADAAAAPAIDTAAESSSVASQDEVFGSGGAAPGTRMASFSAFRSLNSADAGFAAESMARAAEDIGARHAPLPLPSRHYQAISLLLLLTAAIGISAAVVRYQETRPVKTAAHRPNAEAQELYLRGRYYWNLRTEEGLNSALDLFTQSIVNDPHYAGAYAGLADAYLLLRQYGHMPNAEAYPRALAAARQAIALDDSSPEAHRSLAFILRFWNWDMTAAEKEYRRAIELNPNDSQSHHWYATALLSSNRYREALTEIDIARRLEPQSVSVLADRGLILSMMDLRQGEAALRQTEEVQPGFASTHVYLAEDYLRAEDYDNFLAESRVAAGLSHNAAIVAVLDAAGKTLSARGPEAMLREIAAKSAPLADHGAAPAYTTARYFGLAGEPREAMRYLRLASDHREPDFLNVEDDPAFKQLRASAELKTLISRRDVLTGGGKQPIARLDAPELP